MKHFFELAGDLALPESALIACIGPVTAQAVRDRGYDPAVVADDYTADGLADALVAYFAKGPRRV